MHRALLATALLTACTSAPDAADPALHARAEALAASGFVGVQVVSGDRWATAGVARQDGDLELRRDSRFRIASTTKPFVAAAVLQLVTDGALGLEDPVDAWLPGALGRRGAITVRPLLQPRSGLANHVDALTELLGAATTPDAARAILARTWTAPELVALALAREAPFEPGEGWAYSDTNYVVLGMIVQAATGARWQDVVTDRVIAPLHLEHTFAAASDPAIPGEVMHGYARLPGSDALQDVTALSPSSLDAAAAIVSTPGDIQTFLRALIGGELLGPAALAELEHTVDLGEGVGYGLGIAQLTASCGTTYWSHDGDTLGSHTRTGITGDAARSAVIALTGDGDDDAALAVIDDAICGRL